MTKIIISHWSRAREVNNNLETNLALSRDKVRANHVAACGHVTSPHL